MSKTSQNLKVLEKKIRQAAKTIEKLKQNGRADRISKPSTSGYTDLPLLKGISSSRSTNPDVEKLSKEREQLKKRIQNILNEIEKAIG